jgi:hypothetical protein
MIMALESIMLRQESRNRVTYKKLNVWWWLIMKQESMRSYSLRELEECICDLWKNLLTEQLVAGRSIPMLPNSTSILLLMALFFLDSQVESSYKWGILICTVGTIIFFLGVINHWQHWYWNGQQLIVQQAGFFTNHKCILPTLWVSSFSCSLSFLDTSPLIE